jgi:hypothetical protein
MVHNTHSNSLGRLLSTALVFSAGVLLSDRVKHFIGTYDAPNQVPRVEVSYTPNGVLIDKQPYSNGRIGGPRCDWEELNLDVREAYVSREIESQPNLFPAYLRTLSAQRKEQVVYTTLVHLARERGTTPAKQAEEVRDMVGWRWNLAYTKPDTLK